MIRSGFDPAKPYWYNVEGADHATASESVRDHPLSPPNLAGHYHFALQTFWESRGLGAKCFLISESRGVGAYLSKKYKDTEFTSLDLYTDLQNEKFGDSAEQPDAIWDVNSSPLTEIGKCNSVIAHALLEHIIDPVRAIANMLGYLEPSGCLYLMTHTPSFHIHRYPRDYLRFNSDFWEDLPEHLSNTKNLSVTLSDLYMHDGVVCVCYQLNPDA